MGKIGKGQKAKSKTGTHGQKGQINKPKWSQVKKTFGEKLKPLLIPQEVDLKRPLKLKYGKPPFAENQVVS